MIQKINKTDFQGNGGIKALYPGLLISDADSGIATIGRIDHALFSDAAFIAMHPHINDEILSYFRTGVAEHKDSEGITESVGGKKLMLMKAGKIFYHQEQISGQNGQPFEGLQIFIRPKAKDLTPEVSFYDLEQMHSPNQWRLLASPNGKTPLQFSSQSWVYDAQLFAGETLHLPEINNPDLLFLVYIFQGKAKINNNELNKQEGLIIQNEHITITTDTQAELVLFITDTSAEVFTDGMYSGNKI